MNGKKVFGEKYKVPFIAGVRKLDIQTEKFPKWRGQPISDSEYANRDQSTWIAQWNKNMYSKQGVFLSLVLLAMFVFPMNAQGRGPNPEATEDVRQVVAQKRLTSEKQTVVLYAQGLCCPNCAIGIRKTVSRLAFVDQSRFEKGVDLDAKHQLVTIALKSGKKVDNKALSQAIDDAGYVPVHLYEMDGDKLKKLKLTVE